MVASLSLQAKWCYQPVTWLLYRFAVAIYFTVWLFVIISTWGDLPYRNPPADTKVKWLIYVSNWVYLCLCVYFIMSALSTLLFHIKTNFKGKYYGKVILTMK